MQQEHDSIEDRYDTNLVYDCLKGASNLGEEDEN